MLELLGSGAVAARGRRHKLLALVGQSGGAQGTQEYSRGRCRRSSSTGNRCALLTALLLLALWRACFAEEAAPFPLPPRPLAPAAGVAAAGSTARR